MIKDIDVFILCGGLGKRLRAISRNNPKPMVEIGGKPFLDLILNYMAGFGFRRFILGTGYKAGAIKEHYTRNKKTGLNILFSRERSPLDTGGAVKNARKKIRSRYFFVLNGDSYCKFNPLDFVKFHNKNKAVVSILLGQVSDGREYGIVELDRSLCIKSFNEKRSKAKKCLVNVGVYIFDRQVFDLMPQRKRFSLERDFFPSLTGGKTFGYPKSSFFIDIGTPERYIKAKKHEDSIWNDRHYAKI
ncbi:MAG: sugar phosphate nucleotidyltransferase [Candidatus Omnitrophota bacterium]|nr:sugar phosphate nucleotidyltransferase [Candidatus Omnitrophota bacterium]